MKSWKTTIAGWAGIVGAIATAIAVTLEGDPGAADWGAVLAMLGCGLGLNFARDAKVSDEDEGCGKF